MNFCQVAVKYPGIHLLTYCHQNLLKKGMLVKVPLGKRTTDGCIIEYGISSESILKETRKMEIKPIGDEINSNFQLSSSELALFQWMSAYYHYSLGQLIFNCLPRILKRPLKMDISRGKGGKLPPLTPEQNEVFSSIKGLLGNRHDKFYLHGITGSGKTFVYLYLIRENLKKGYTTLFLLPEINLTPQFVRIFNDYLDCPVLTYHSGISVSQKNQLWKYVKNTTNPVLVMGVRSAVFLPVNLLGLIIVDEEHDTSFKQSDRCPYNGRDVAIKKAHLAGIPIVLGSATPSLENYHAFACQKKLHYFTLKKRVGKGALPQIEILDARHHFDDSIWPFVPKSIEAVQNALQKKEQVLVFINRLGHAGFIQCRACGYRFVDPQTDTNLRYFKRKKILKSVHSDFKMAVPEICPACGNMKLLQKGYGTEKVQEVLKRLYPKENIARFDRDEITTIAKLEETLKSFHKGEISVLVGTQMLAKGHNFKRVNTVLVLGIDQQLNFPDFRVLERAYQLLVQIAGRAGRFSQNAKVLIQTLSGEAPLFDYIRTHCFDGFYKSEIDIRRYLQFPPFTRMATIYFHAQKRDNAIISAQNAKQFLLNTLKNIPADKSNITGPAPALIERKSSKYSWCLLVKCTDVIILNKSLAFFHRHFKQKGVTIKIDVDPYFCL